jgi:hypothetical protein
MKATTRLSLEVLEDRLTPSTFTIANGQILDPSGNPWVAKASITRTVWAIRSRF